MVGVVIVHVHRHSSLRLRRYQREAASRCFRTTSMMTSPLAKPGATSPKEDEGDGDDDGSDDDSN